MEVSQQIDEVSVGVDSDSCNAEDDSRKVCPRVISSNDVVNIFVWFAATARFVVNEEAGLTDEVVVVIGERLWRLSLGTDDLHRKRNLHTKSSIRLVRN